MINFNQKHNCIKAIVQSFGLRKSDIKRLPWLTTKPIPTTLVPSYKTLTSLYIDNAYNCNMFFFNFQIVYCGMRAQHHKSFKLT